MKKERLSIKKLTLEKAFNEEDFGFQIKVQALTLALLVLTIYTQF